MPVPLTTPTAKRVAPSEWGVVLATAIVVLLPEKLQVIQEYRFLLYAAMVIAILLFRPVGPKELDLIRASGFRAFPPRLPEQTIF